MYRDEYELRRLSDLEIELREYRNELCDPTKPRPRNRREWDREWDRREYRRRRVEEEKEILSRR